MIESNVINSKDKNILSYPKLMIAPQNGQIVLFESCGCGTVIVMALNGGRPIGYYGTSFCSELFIDFDGEITLKNKV